MSGDGWVANIGLRERRRRLAAGAVGFVAAAAGLLALLAVDADRLWRLALFVPLFVGGVGFFQHREKT